MIVTIHHARGDLFPHVPLLTFTPPEQRTARCCRWCGKIEDDEDLVGTILQPEFNYFHDLCDRCHLDMIFPDVSVQLSFHRGCTPWSDGGYAGLENTPLLCVLTAPEYAWYKAGPSYDEVNKHETWLFFRNRDEWKAAQRIARVLVEHDNDPAVFYAYARFVDVAGIAGWKVAGGTDFHTYQEDL